MDGSVGVALRAGRAPHDPSGRRTTGDQVNAPHHARWLLGVVVLAALGCSARAPESRVGSAAARDGVATAGGASELIGTWRLVEFWDRDSAQAPKRYPYGERPTGYFVYDPTGHVSIQLQTGPTPPHIAPARGEDWFRAASPEELRAAVEAFRAYFGTYTVDLARGVVVHQVEGDSRGLYTGTRQERQFRLFGDSLIIGNEMTGRRVLVRVR